MSAWRPSPRDSANPVVTLFDAARQHYDIRLTCWRCKRNVVFLSAALWWLFERKGHSDRLNHVQQKLRCSQCGAKLPALDLVRDAPAHTNLPMPSDREWKDAVRRRR